MAKSNGIISLRGKLGKLVFVQSRYGNHVRLARGTLKPASVNDTLKANAGRSATLNQLASPFYAVLCRVSERYRDGGAWARILSRFRKTASEDPALLFPQLEGMFMHEAYPLTNAWQTPAVTVRVKPKQLLAAMQTAAPPSFTRSKATDVFRYQLTALFKSNRNNTWITDGAYTDWMPYSTGTDAWDFSFDRPAGHGIYVLVLRLEAGLGGKAIGTQELTRVMVYRAGMF